MIKAIVLSSFLCSPLTAEEYKLVWSDEFNTAGKLDTSKWKFEEGFIRNFEAQYYTKNRAKNARVEQGNLVLEAHKEAFENAAFEQHSTQWQRNWKTAKYTSASVQTLGQKAFLYGKFEIRAKVPKGNGTWPAIWMLGENWEKVGWPSCGEIDILEQLGREPKKIHGTIHWNAGNDANGNYQHAHVGGTKIVKDDVGDAFHLFGLEWTRNSIEFFLDGKSYYKIDISKMPATQSAQFRKPHFLLINFALGGTWGKEIDPAIFPQKFLIDYVRVYQKQTQ